MTRLSGLELLSTAHDRGQKGVPCLDVAGGNSDILHEICAVLAETETCAFLSSTPRSIEMYLGMAHFVRAVDDAVARFGVTATAHLDHAEDLSDIAVALDLGVRSVLYDGSTLPLDENIERTKAAIRIAHGVGASVEAEAGLIGGKEGVGEPVRAALVTAEETTRLLSEAKPDLFAPAVGTVHGPRNAEASIDWGLAEWLGENYPVPLVLHGATGLPADQVRRLVALGFRKVNYATAIRGAFTTGLREGLGENGTARPQPVLAAGRARVRATVAEILVDLAG